MSHNTLNAANRTLDGDASALLLSPTHSPFDEKLDQSWNEHKGRENIQLLTLRHDCANTFTPDEPGTGNLPFGTLESSVVRPQENPELPPSSLCRKCHIDAVRRAPALESSLYGKSAWFSPLGTHSNFRPKLASRRDFVNLPAHRLFCPRVYIFLTAKQNTKPVPLCNRCLL